MRLLAVALFLLGSIALPCQAEDPRSLPRRRARRPFPAGCSAGACHGSPTGKGGFRLSLRGFDPALDELTLIREDFGRRVNPHDPDASLILLKPLMQVSHGGGQKLTKSDPAYRISATGSPRAHGPIRQDAAACQKIEVQPKSAELRHPDWQQQLAVRRPFQRRHACAM